MSCLIAGALLFHLQGAGFTLEWTHSVEKTAWREEWQIQNGQLVLTRAAVKGSGAGMDPGPGAQLRDGWWVWQPLLPPQDDLLLAASGATGGGWTICDGADCTSIGQQAREEPIRLRPCP